MRETPPAQRVRLPEMPPRPRVREARGGCMQPQRRRETRQPGAAVHWAARRHKRSCGRHMCGLRDGVCSLRGDIRGLWCGMRGLWAAYAVCGRHMRSGRRHVQSVRLAVHAFTSAFSLIPFASASTSAFNSAGAPANARHGVLLPLWPEPCLGCIRRCAPLPAARGVCLPEMPPRLRMRAAPARRIRRDPARPVRRLAACAAPQARSSAKKYAAAGKVHGFARGSCFLLPGCSILKAQGRAAAPPTSLF